VNRSNEFDVVVVGGGPIGAIVAKGAAKRGLKTVVIEEHKIIGEPQHCAGLISVNGFHRLNLIPSERIVLNKVRGASVFSPSGEELLLERSGPQAFVADRISFDKQLADEATESGSTLLLNTKAQSTRIENTGVQVIADIVDSNKAKHKITLTGELLVLAEGSQPRLTRNLGLEVPNPKMRLYATQFEMSHVKLESEDLVEIYLGNVYACGFFAWIIPTGNGSARVGLASSLPKPHALLSHFVSHHRVAAKKLRGAKTMRILGGRILTGGPISRTYSTRLLAVGDCAGQTKPTTGGGVVTGGICAHIAGKVASESVIADNFSAQYLERYDRSWRRQLGQEFSMMHLVRRLLNHLPDFLTDKLIRSMRNSGFGSLIEEKGDIDTQSQLVRSAIINPKRMIVFLLSFLGIL